MKADLTNISALIFFLFSTMKYSQASKSDSINSPKNLIGIHYSILPRVDKISKLFYSELSSSIKNNKVGLFYGRELINYKRLGFWLSFNASLGEVKYEYFHVFNGLTTENIHYKTEYNLFYNDIVSNITFKIKQGKTSSFYINSSFELSGLYALQGFTTNLSTGKKEKFGKNQANKFPSHLFLKDYNSISIGIGIESRFLALKNKEFIISFLFKHNLSNDKYFNGEFSTNKYGCTINFGHIF